MNIYLVGGAVRDQFLGYPFHERDWVVVGGSAEQLLNEGYQQVGKDFPVFLHPKTGEEYALARKERKLAPGYHGFSCEFGSDVCLEDDLARRDLTINAMAMDCEGRLIDPYGGMQDLQNKWFRHVSPSFIEDPVRVLRVARFAARFHHLGFRLADETRQLMYSMVCNGELAHLVAERVWQEWQKSLSEKNPECFVNVLRSCGGLRVILPEIDALFGVPNSYEHHHEVDSGIHTLMVLREAVALSADPLLRFAAILHDLGKACTPIHAWPSHHGHEELGVPVIEALCERLRLPTEYRRFTVMVSRFHIMIHRLYELRASTIVSLLEQVDAFRRPSGFENLLIVCQADAQGRSGAGPYFQANGWRHILKECAKISAQILIAEGHQGHNIKTGLHQRRVGCVQSIIHSWKLHEK